MRRAPASCLLVLALAALAGCGTAGAPGEYVDAGPSAADASQPPSDGAPYPDDGGAEDAPVSPDGDVIEPDATVACFNVVLDPPAVLQAPTGVSAKAVATTPSLAYPTAWRVTGPTRENLYFSEDPPSTDHHALKIRFTAGVQGPYEVVAEPACAPLSVTVTDSPDAKVFFYLRYTPRPSEGVPAQEDPVGYAVVKGTTAPQLLGSRQLTGARTLDNAIDGVGAGTQVTFQPQVRQGDWVSWPVSLYTRTDQVTGQIKVQGQILDTDQMMVVVPADGTQAPYQTLLSAQELSLPTSLPYVSGTRLSGRVVDAHDAGVPDTYVSVGEEGLPPALVKTNDQGDFGVDVRDKALRFEVFPPAGSGRAALVVDPSLQVKRQDGPVLITLADVAPVLLSGWKVMNADRTNFLGGAHVTFVAQVPGAKITQGGVTHILPASPESETRVRVEADAGGTLPDVTLPAGLYDVVVEPPITTPSDVLALVTDFDLRGPIIPTPGVLTTATPVVFALQINYSAGAAISRAHVTAVAQGFHGVQKGAALFAEVDDAGDEVSLVGPPGMTYDLVVDGLSGSATTRARGLAIVPATTPVDIVVQPVDLLPVVQLFGTLHKADSDNPAVGVTVSVHCRGAGCPDPSDFIYDETTTDATGTFHLAVPDLAGSLP